MKNSNKFWLKFLVGLGVILISFAVGYGMLNQKVNNHNKRIEKVELKAGETHDKVIKIEVDVEHIRKTVDRIEKKL
ncbi:unnamed protein product [marine sediment metagenome]|uniref:Uncharacterized protein n=1 Tax=marine sediment metagenome TaxID=412755 RepID=X1J989_9ZZZZ